MKFAKSLFLIVAASSIAMACRVRKDDSSDLASQGTAVASANQISLVVPAKDPESGYEIYFHSPRIASEMYWDLKTKRLEMKDAYKPTFKMADVDAAIKAYEAQSIATGDSAFVVDVYINDGFVADTRVGRVVIRSDDLKRLSSGAKLRVYKNKVNNDSASFDVTVIKK